MNISNDLNIVNNFIESTPVDVAGMARAMGLGCHSAYLIDGISGMLENTGENNYKLSVNASDSPTRQRFTIAHEIGHYILHRNILGEGVDDNKAYRSIATGKFHNTNIGPRQETEANRFAASILMPEKQVRKAKQANPQASNRFLADRFNVSEMAMKIRLESLGLGCQ